MAMDLTTAHDHPAVLLTERRQEMAATILRDYESERGITFAALDNDTLASLRAAYEAIDGPNSGQAMADLVNAVGDLLGLGEG